MIPLPTLNDAPKFGIASRHRLVLTMVLFLSVVVIVILSSYLPGHDAFGCPDPSLSSDITEFNHSKFNKSPTNDTRTININSGAILTDLFRFPTFTNFTLGFKMVSTMNH